MHQSAQESKEELLKSTSCGTIIMASEQSQRKQSKYGILKFILAIF